MKKRITFALCIMVILLCFTGCGTKSGWIYVENRTDSFSVFNEIYDDVAKYGIYNENYLKIDLQSDKTTQERSYTVGKYVEKNGYLDIEIYNIIYDCYYKGESSIFQNPSYYGVQTGWTYNENGEEVRYIITQDGALHRVEGDEYWVESINTSLYYRTATGLENSNRNVSYSKEGVVYRVFDNEEDMLNYIRECNDFYKY